MAVMQTTGQPGPLVRIVTRAVVALALGVGGLSGPSVRRDALPFPPQRYLDGLVANAPIPPGAKKWTKALRYSPVELESSYYFPASGFMLDRLVEFSYRAYTTNVGPHRLMRYVVAHLPTGEKLTKIGPPTGPYRQTGFELSVPGPDGSGYSGVIDCTVTPRDRDDFFLWIDAWAYWNGTRLRVEAVPVDFIGKLTVFRGLSPTKPSFGAVTVNLTSRNGRRAIGTLNALRVAAMRNCMEDSLLYRLTLHPRDKDRPVYEVQGWQCPPEVSVALNGVELPPLGDTACSLLDLVKRVAPSFATGTRRAAIDCSV